MLPAKYNYHWIQRNSIFDTEFSDTNTYFEREICIYFPSDLAFMKLFFGFSLSFFSASVSVVWLLIHHRSSVFCCLFFCDCRYFSEAPEVLLTHYIVKLNINVVRAHVIPSFYFCTTCINHCSWCVVWFSCHFCCCLIATLF